MTIQASLLRRVFVWRIGAPALAILAAIVATAARRDLPAGVVDPAGTP